MPKPSAPPPLPLSELRGRRLQQEIPGAPSAINRLGILGPPATSPSTQAISIATPGRQPSSSGREQPDGSDLFDKANEVLDEILIFVLTDYSNLNLERLKTEYRQFLTASREAIRERIIKYIFDNGLFDDVSDEVQAAVISLINDAFMDKIKRYMESKIQMLRIGQSADVIATQTPKSASPGIPPTPSPPPQKRVITEAEILGTQTPKGPTPRRSPPISAEQQLATQTAKFRPSAQPYIAPPPKVSAAEQLATQTSEGTPSQKRVIKGLRCSELKRQRTYTAERPDGRRSHPSPISEISSFRSTIYSTSAITETSLNGGRYTWNSNA